MRAWIVVTLLVLVISAGCSRGSGDPGVSDGDQASAMGARIYGDICARCHGEEGRGHPPGVPPLADAEVRKADSPLGLLRRIVASDAGSEMPAYGTRLAPSEIVAVASHLRRKWGGEGRPIEPKEGVPPREIADLERRYARAQKRQDLDALVQCYRADDVTGRPHLVRGEQTDARGREAVREAWAARFAARSRDGTELVRHSLPGARYATGLGPVVVATGRVFLELHDEVGKGHTAKGRFLRVYEQEGGGEWRLSLDFADLEEPRSSREK